MTHKHESSGRVDTPALTDEQLDAIIARGSQTLASTESRRALMREAIKADRELTARGAAAHGVREPELGAWERRQGHRGGQGEWFWNRWRPCTEAEAKRVTGLRSWEVRRLSGGANTSDEGTRK